MGNNGRKESTQKIDGKSEEYIWEDRSHDKNEGRIHKKFY